MRKYRILELVITRDQTRNALHAPSRSLQESPQEGTAGTEPTLICGVTVLRLQYKSILT